MFTKKPVGLFIHYTVPVLLLVALIIVSLGSVTIVYSSSLTMRARSWNNRLARGLIWLLDRVVGLNTSEYYIDSVRIEDTGPNSTYYIVMLRGAKNSTVEVPVVVDNNGKIVEFALRGVIHRSDLLKTYRLGFLEKISSQSIINNISAEDAGTLLNIVVNTVEALSHNSTILRIIEGKIKVPSMSIELNRVDSSTYRAEINAGDNIEVEITVHDENRVLVINTYYTFHIYKDVVYKHNVLQVLIKALPPDYTLYFISGLKYEPYNITIHMIDRLGKPEEYIPKVTKYVESYLSSKGCSGCGVGEVKFYGVYGRVVGFINDTKIIHLYYTYIVETNKYNYTVSLDPINGTILSVNPYGTVEDDNKDNNGANLNPPVYIITTTTVLGIIGVITALYKKRILIRCS